MSPERQAAIDLVEEAVSALVAIVGQENGEGPSVLTGWSVVAARSTYVDDDPVAHSLVGVYSQDTLPEWQQRGLLDSGLGLVRAYMDSP